MVWTGNIEQWHKLSQLEPIYSGLLSFNSGDNTDWISVFKKRIQKIKENVKSELTWLKIDGEHWWSIAFEMTQDFKDKQQNCCFQEVIERSSQTYYGSELLAKDSYSYSRWLLLLNQ